MAQNEMRAQRATSWRTDVRRNGGATNGASHAVRISAAIGTRTQGVVIENLPLSRFAPVSLCGTASNVPVPLAPA